MKGEYNNFYIHFISATTPGDDSFKGKPQARNLETHYGYN